MRGERRFRILKSLMTVPSSLPPKGRLDRADGDQSTLFGGVTNRAA